MSKYCCTACSKRTYKKRQIAKEKEAQRKALAKRIPASKGYLTIPEAVLLYGISRNVLYRMICKGLIPSHNFGQRQTRLSRQYMDERFKIKSAVKKKKRETLSFEPKDCYTIGEIAKKFHINDSSVFKHIHHHSIPTSRRNTLCNMLPDTFTKRDYDAAVLALGENGGMANKWIEIFIRDGKLCRMEQGKYKKIF